MKMYVIAGSLVVFGLVSACGQIRLPGQDETAADPAEVAVEVEVPPIIAEPEPTPPLRKTADINWSAARADFAARETGDDGMVSVAGGSNPPVPVLLPDTPVGLASGESALQFRPTADGYFAVQKGETYDLIITGTDKLVAAPEGSAVADTELRFEETMTGAQVSFSRYGASYLAQFMCKDPATARLGSCIAEEDAKTVVQDLLIAGTR